MPVLVILPVYAILYFGAFGNRHAAAVTPLSDGNTVFHANCAACHGSNGEGGVGPKLAGGEAVKTFPNAATQISWVKTGSGPFTGKLYGDPNRAGGQHGPAKGGMPAFGGSLSEQQIQDVVLYERTGL
jgi:mono/diheme cytochrome c family protein